MISKEYKLYAFTDMGAQFVGPDMVTVAPMNINYNILGLHKKRTFVKGEISTVEYYADYDLVTKEYKDLILKEEREYLRLDGLAYQRNMKVTWYYLDDTQGESKSTVKYYPPDESIKEGISRRTNIISNLKMVSFGTLGSENAYDLLSSIYNELGLYKDGYTQPLLDSLAILVKPYLDSTFVADGVTLRMYLISEMTI
ncbi:MAG: hypothetical protein SLAVMIC_00534 [uncultured marine phage]|uniref:Uncharacterized protein n=1 Tax=uncultured marine phage TaxID=707152 RepID=A0A8D9C929_9VIRU|nr:MAG: hypothetical protein SLAVMIC_00534 [uncultured marine phage]